MTSRFGDYDFVVVANRLPVDRITDAGRSVDWRPSPGGLVTALEPVMQTGRGSLGRLVRRAGLPRALRRRRHAAGRVGLTDEEVRDYYEGFSNGTLWPLYHDVIVPPEFHRHWWDAYVTGQPPLRRGRRGRRPPRAPSSGCRTTSCNWCRACCGSRGPTCGSGSSTTSRSPATRSSPSCRGAGRSCEGLLGADLIGFQRQRTRPTSCGPAGGRPTSTTKGSTDAGTGGDGRAR